MAGIRELSALSVGAFALVVAGLPASAAPGDLDAGYGTGGRALLELPGLDEETVTDSALDGEGRLVVTGYDGMGVSFVARLTADGALDTSFSSDGVELAPAGVNQLAAVEVQPDGKIVAVGRRANPTTGIFVTRLTDDGSPDADFATAGQLDLIDPSNTMDIVTDLGVQPGGRLTLVGTRSVLSDTDILVVNLTTDGDLDLGFGGGTGAAALELGLVTEAVNAVAFGPGSAAGGSSIYLAGTRSEGGSDDAFIAKVTNTGELDTGFGGVDGYATVSFGVLDDGFDVVVDREGKLVLTGSAGTTDPDVFVARFRADGELDTGFSSDGIVTVDVGTESGDNDEGRAVALQADGRIVVGASTYNNTMGLLQDYAAVRILPDGTPDTSFDDDGKVVIQVGEVTDTLADVTIDANGRILLAGNYSPESGGSDVAVVGLTGQTTRCGGQLVTVDLALGYGPTKGADVVRGTTAADSVNSKGGADIVCGLAGPDELIGGRGADRLIGGAGEDDINGSRGDDTLIGGLSNDVLNGGKGNDTCKGGPGNDQEISC